MPWAPPPGGAATVVVCAPDTNVSVWRVRGSTALLQPRRTVTPMGRQRSVHRCGACGVTTTRWAGRCPACGEWNALVEEAVPVPVPGLAPGRRQALDGAVPVPLGAVDVSGAAPRPTGLPEL